MMMMMTRKTTVLCLMMTLGLVCVNAPSMRHHRTQKFDVGTKGHPLTSETREGVPGILLPIQTDNQNYYNNKTTPTTITNSNNHHAGETDEGTANPDMTTFRLSSNSENVENGQDMTRTSHRFSKEGVFRIQSGSGNDPKDLKKSHPRKIVVGSTTTTPTHHQSTENVTIISPAATTHGQQRAPRKAHLDYVSTVLTAVLVPLVLVCLCFAIFCLYCLEEKRARAAWGRAQRFEMVQRPVYENIAMRDIMFEA